MTFSQMEIGFIMGFVSCDQSGSLFSSVSSGTAPLISAMNINERPSENHYRLSSGFTVSKPNVLAHFNNHVRLPDPAGFQKQERQTASVAQNLVSIKY